MDRRSKVATLLTAALLCAASLAAAGVPDCSISVIPNVIACPDGTIPTTMTILSTSGPINGAVVELRYTAVANGAACWCAVQVHPTISGVTNASGVVTFNVHGGGCLNPAVISGGVAIQVYVNNIACKNIGQVSPDVILNTPGSCSVTLSDAVDFTGDLSTGTYSYCHDLNSDLAVGLTDAVIFTTPAAVGATCP